MLWIGHGSYGRPDADNFLKAVDGPFIRSLALRIAYHWHRGTPTVWIAFFAGRKFHSIDSRYRLLLRSVRSSIRCSLFALGSVTFQNGIAAKIDTTQISLRRPSSASIIVPYRESPWIRPPAVYLCISAIGPSREILVPSIFPETFPIIHHSRAICPRTLDHCYHLELELSIHLRQCHRSL